MECKYITEYGILCGLGCTEKAGHCWRHINQVEEAMYCYDLIVARGMPKPRLRNDPGMPNPKVITPVIEQNTFSPGEE